MALMEKDENGGERTRGEVGERSNKDERKEEINKERKNEKKKMTKK